MISHKIDYGRTKKVVKFIGEKVSNDVELVWFDRPICFISNYRDSLFFLAGESPNGDRYFVCPKYNMWYGIGKNILDYCEYVVDTDKDGYIEQCWICDREKISMDLIPQDSTTIWDILSANSSFGSKQQKLELPVEAIEKMQEIIHSPSSPDKLKSIIQNDIRSWVDRSYGLAKEKGWHEGEDSKTDFAARLMLIVGELSEALEEYRKNPDIHHFYYSENNKPEGIKFELADAVIRIFDLCGKYNIDIQSAMIEKHEFNKTRPHRHGNKTI